MKRKVSSPGRTFVLIGGAGYVGLFLVRFLLSRNNETKIIVVSRNQSKAMFFLGEARVRFVSSLSELNLSNCIIVNLAFSLSLTKKDTISEATRAIEQLKRALPKQFDGVLIHVSSVAVHGYPLTQSAIECAALRSLSKYDVYSYSKGYTEKKLIQFARRTNCKLVIVRSGNVMGPGSTWLLKIANRLNAGLPLLGPDQSCRSNATFVGNLVYALAILPECLDWTSKKIQILNLAEFGNESWGEWILPISRAIGTTPVVWQKESSDAYQLGILGELAVIRKEMIKVAIPKLYKGVATGRVVNSILNFGNANNIKNNAKSYIASQAGLYSMDSQEFNMANVFLNPVSVGVEGLPEKIKVSMPYCKTQAIDSLLSWLNYCHVSTRSQL